MRDSAAAEGTFADAEGALGIVGVFLEGPFGVETGFTLGVPFLAGGGVALGVLPMGESG